MNVEPKTRIEDERLFNAVSIDIRGAKGKNAVIINGIYDPIEEICNGWPVYRKHSDHSKWLEFSNQTNNKWYIKATNDRGKPRGWLRLSSDPTTRPDLCKAICEVWDGSKWNSQPSVSIVSARNRKEEDQKAGALRRIRAVPVNISGATGPSASCINGVYEPTDEICGGWPVYHKKDDLEKWLEYIVATNEWYVKPTADRGKAEGWMCIASDPPTRPELSKGSCDVWDGEKWTTQNSVIITAEAGYFQSMTDIHIFCNEEIRKLHEKLTNTLNRTISLALIPIPKDKLDLGQEQIDEMNQLISKKLNMYREQKEIETKELANLTLKDRNTQSI